MTKFLNYNGFYLFIYPLIGSQIFQIVYLVFTGSTDWANELGESMSNTGELFTIYMINQLFFVNGFDMINIPEYLIMRYKELAASNETEKILAYEAPSMLYQREYAVNLTLFVITVSFSVVFPLILIPGTLFFGLRVKFTQYWVFKYNLLCFFRVKKNISIRGVSRVIRLRLICYIFLFQVLSFGVFMLSDYSEIHTFSLVSIVLCFALFVGSLAFLSQLKLEEEGGEEMEELLDIDSRAYHHPVEKLNLSELA